MEFLQIHRNQLMDEPPSTLTLGRRRKAVTLVNQLVPDSASLSHYPFGYSHSEIGMLSPHIKEVNGMIGTQRNSLNGSATMAMMPERLDRDVVLAFNIEADRSRVLYALSVPEYIEAWLHAPDPGELQFAFNPVAQETFQIDLYRAKELQASIHGACQVVNANQIRYTWRKMSPVGSTETLVDMQLLGGSGACLLGLKHSGFKDLVESEWCRRMWDQSLERLCRLMGKI